MICFVFVFPLTFSNADYGLHGTPNPTSRVRRVHHGITAVQRRLGFAPGLHTAAQAADKRNKHSLFFCQQKPHHIPSDHLAQADCSKYVPRHGWCKHSCQGAHGLRVSAVRCGNRLPSEGTCAGRWGYREDRSSVHVGWRDVGAKTCVRCVDNVKWIQFCFGY